MHRNVQLFSYQQAACHHNTAEVSLLRSDHIWLCTFRCLHTKNKVYKQKTHAKFSMLKFHSGWDARNHDAALLR